ncbi:De-etiolated protein 1 Det1-domain-containing protein [Chytriomyces sp. MP71]|nr:De-etiolated protein 1 Det1-domain-containing protein [Chytriomyces sp. MP71]
MLSFLRQRETAPTTTYCQTRRGVHSKVVMNGTARSVVIPTCVDSLLGFSGESDLVVAVVGTGRSIAAFRLHSASWSSASASGSLFGQESSDTAAPVPGWNDFLAQTPLFETPLARAHESIVKDFILFCGPANKWALFATVAPCLAPAAFNNAYPHALYTNATSTLGFTRQSDNITLWLVCLKSGNICDSVEFMADHILLSHAAGVQIDGDIMAVTSVKNQTIYLFHIKESGSFIKLREIGTHNHDDDAFVLSQARADEEAYLEATGRSIKHLSSLSYDTNESSSSSSSPPSVPSSSHRNSFNSYRSFLPASIYRQHYSSTISASPSTTPAPAPIQFRAPTDSTGPVRGADIRRQLRRSQRSTVLPRVTLAQSNPTTSAASALLASADPRSPWNLFSSPAGHGLPLPQGPPPTPPTPPGGRTRRAGQIFGPAPAAPSLKDLPLSGIKQRLMAFLYRQAMEFGTPVAIQQFYMTFDQYASLVMWKMQFLSDSHILIKFGSVDNSVGRNIEPTTSHPCIFAIYSLETTRVTAVFDNASHELLELYQSWPQFRHAGGRAGGMAFITTACNNAHAREFVKRQLYSVRKAKNGGVAQAVKRILAGVPMNPQSYIESPYLDQSIFHYDEGIINNVNRPRSWSSEYPIKFWDRQTRGVRFKLDPNPARPGTPDAAALMRAK